MTICVIFHLAIYLSTLYIIFVLQFTLNDPEVFPVTHCATEIYHLNIDPSNLETDIINVCVSRLDDWEESNDLENCVQAILFLFHNPNPDEPLAPCFDPSISYEDFKKNVRLFMEGGEVGGFTFGYIENGMVKKNVSENNCSVQINSEQRGKVNSNVSIAESNVAEISNSITEVEAK